jgi:tetratricopeptide (TPR) repeat protein
MAIQSSISELGLIDLFQILSLQKKTGQLLISDGPGGKEARVLFTDGSVGFANIYERMPKSSLALLVDWGVLDKSAARLIEAELSNYNNLAECLDGEGVVSISYLGNLCATHTQQSVYELFKWSSGTCRFTEATGYDKAVDILVSLNTENLILEGARRIDEWENITAKVPSPYSVFKICTSSTDGQRLNLNPKEWEILSLIDGKSSVHEASEAVSCDLFTTSKLFYGLVVMNVIELVENDADQAVGSENETPKVETLVKRGIEYFKNGSLERAAAEYEKAIQIDTDCFEAMRMLGEIYYKLDRLSEAADYLKKTRAANPDNEKAIFISGQLYARLGDVKMAIQEWRKLRNKTVNSKVAAMMKHNIIIAKKWERVLRKY